MGAARKASRHESGILQDDPVALAEVVADLVVAYGILDRNTLEAAIAARVPSPPPVAPIIVRAWRDPEFRAHLLADAFGACAEAGLTIAPTSPRAVVLDNTGDMHHVVVCTLCSCHSRPLMGVPPAWYKAHEYRSRAVREPRAVLAEFGLHIDHTRPIRVQDASADLRYIVLPAPPDGWEGVTDEALASTITPDVLLGVSLPRLA
jgi:nitrile hydratase